MSLEHLKVIELSSVLAGPSVGQFFSELGAKVIKIENKRTGGDVTRSWKLKNESKDKSDSAYFNAANFGKESLFINLKDQQDFKTLTIHLIEADIIITNFKAGDAEKYQLDFESIKSINPRVIYGEIIGFPDSNRVAYDMVLQAESGWLSMNGKSKDELCKIPVAIIDLFAAHQLKEGILLALLKQDGKAKRVQVSLYESAISALANQATNWLVAKQEAEPIGLLHPNIAPYGDLFLCKDGKAIVLAVGSNDQFTKLCHVLDMDHLANHTNYSSNQLRVKNRSELAETIKPLLLEKDRKVWMQLFEDNWIPAGALKSISEVFQTKAAKSLILNDNKSIGLSQIAFNISE